jgi:TRAP-type C4-dicarboxylate transport system permease small subunit
MAALRKNLLAVRSGLHRLEDGALVLALVSMLVMALTQIVLRNVFDSGLLWAESFLRILVLWVAILGAMVATRDRNHISIVSLLFAAVLCAIAAYHSVVFISYEYEDGTIAFAEVPVWFCQSIMPIGFGVMALRFLYSAFVREQ